MACTCVSFPKADLGAAVTLFSVEHLSSQPHRCQHWVCVSRAQAVWWGQTGPGGEPPEKNRTLNCKALLQDPKNWVRLRKLSI